MRLYGYPRGQQSAANTVGSIIAEGLREETHSHHLTEPPQIEIYNNPESPIKHPRELGRWINTKMDTCRFARSEYHPNGRKMRTDSVAIGTLIASLPQKTLETDRSVIDDFRERSQAWFKAWLEERDMLQHTCILHLDEAHPHIHIWFTPNLELIEKGEWPLGLTTFPKRNVLQKLQKDFFEDVGQHFYSQRTKPKSQRRMRLDRKTAIQLRDMPEAVTSHPIYDIGFFNFAFILEKIAGGKDAERQTHIMEAVMEALDTEAGITNREAFEELIAEHNELKKKYVLEKSSEKGFEK